MAALVAVAPAVAFSAISCGGGSGAGSGDDAGTVPVSMPDGGADAHVSCGAATPPTVDLRLALTDPEIRGTCACAAFTLGQVMNEIGIADPSLADITMLAGEGYADGPALAFAFATPQGFRFVLKRGWGDCPSGCPNNELWYFETDAACVAQPVGHFRALVDDVGGVCYVLEGEPLWGFLSKGPACPPS